MFGKWHNDLWKFGVFTGHPRSTCVHAATITDLSITTNYVQMFADV